MRATASHRDSGIPAAPRRKPPALPRPDAAACRALTPPGLRRLFEARGDRRQLGALPLIVAVAGLLMLLAPLRAAEHPLLRVGALLALAGGLEVLHGVRRAGATALRRVALERAAPARPGGARRPATWRCLWRSSPSRGLP